MRAAPAPRRITPDVEVLPAAVQAAVQSAQSPAQVAYTTGQGGGATPSGTAERHFTDAFSDWQTDAKAAARTVGVARFTANMFALTAARVRLTVEYDSGFGEWSETEDEQYAGIMADYRNETLNQSSSELQRLHAWHYQVAGEGFVCNRDAPGGGGAEWMILSHRAIDWERPQKGQATVRLTPGGSMQNSLAFAIPRNMLVRFWLPDEEYSLLPVSPMTAAMDDLRRWLDLTRYARRVALNYLTVNGLLWTPKKAHESETEATDAILAEAEGIAPAVKDDPLVRLYKQIAATSIANDDRMESVTPTMVWWGDAGDEPVWVEIGRGLDEQGIAHRAEALGDYARDVDAPAALVQGGGTDMASSHWGAWLTEERFHGSIAPLLDRMFHQDLTACYLHPLLRLRGVAEQDLIRWRVGYDPTDVIVHPDKSDLAIRAYLCGLLKDTVALKECGWNPDTDLADDASLQRLMIILAHAGQVGTSGQPAPENPGKALQAPADGQNTTEQPPQQQAASTLAAMVDEALNVGWPDVAAPGGNGHAMHATVGSTLTAERDTGPGTPPPGAGTTAAPPMATTTPAQAFERPGVAPRLARVHPRNDAQRLVGAEMRKYRKVLNRLAKLRADTTRRLLAGAEVAFVEALRLAGIRAVQKARNKNRTMAAAVEQAWVAGEGLRSHLAALGVTEEQVLAGAFDSYEAQAEAWLRARTEQQRQILADAGYDPDEFYPDAPDHDAAAAAFLGLALMALARQRIMAGTDPVTNATPGEVSGVLPAQLGVTAVRISDGVAGFTPGETRDVIPALHVTSTRASTEQMLTDDIRDRLRDVLNTELVTAEGAARDRLEEAIAEFADAPTEYVWTWGFYGDPSVPFEPHQALDGFTTTDPEGDPDLYNSEGFPDGDLFQPGDHEGCTCEWVSQVSSNAEGIVTDALGGATGDVIPGARADESALAQELRSTIGSTGG